jgi:hypothetical protein
MKPFAMAHVEHAVIVLRIMSSNTLTTDPSTDAGRSRIISAVVNHARLITSARRTLLAIATTKFELRDAHGLSDDAAGFSTSGVSASGPNAERGNIMESAVDSPSGTPRDGRTHSVPITSTQ